MIRDSHELLAYVNGELVPASQPAISALDSGFNFGDGVFEGLRVYEGRVFRLDDHIARLYASARAVDIDVGMTPMRFRDEILAWLRANQIIDQFHFRPIVTRGERWPPRVDPRFASGSPNIVFVGASIEPVAGDLRLVVSRVRRTPAESLDPNVKSLNYLNNIQARREAIFAGADDCLMLDDGGFVSEASASNVFLVRDRELLTPFTRSCLAGITRDTVMQLARGIGLRVTETDLTVADAKRADEIFLTGTAAEISPIAELDGLSVGNGDRPITDQLHSLYSALVRRQDHAIGLNAQPTN
jgi:branched-chain amino acid aminotransferase